MEKQKLLWVIFSIAILLVVVIGAGFLWFFPSEKKVVLGKETGVSEKRISALSGGDADFDPVEWVRRSEEFPGLEESAEEEPEDFVIVYGEAEVQDEEFPEVDITETLPVREETPKVIKKPKEEQAAPPKQVAVPVKPKTPEKIRITEYWIQAGSYSSKYRAEQMQEKLSEKGIPSRITSKEVDGTNYFRVRIGPYDNENEAVKFLTWIHEVQGFENSYISQVYASRSLN